MPFVYSHNCEFYISKYLWVGIALKSEMEDSNLLN